MPSIAVLPFVDMSADKEQEYFCDGMAEEIINALTHVERLHVVARTSAFSFKGKELDIREIGKKLNVEHVLEGSVRKAGNRLRITAQLVKISDGYHLWSERYDRNMEDVFEIQDEISLAIVNNLKVKLMEKEKAAIVKHYTENVEAYNQYLKGEYYVEMFTIEGLDKASEFHELALQMDPNYALAYSGLSAVYFTYPFWGNLSPHEANLKAKAYAKKALEIDNTLAEAHASLGFINTHYDWNWKEAEREFKQALQLNPNSTIVHMWYSFFLTITRRNEEAIVEAKRSQKLDPLSSYINSHVGVTLSFAGRYDEAIEELHMTITLNPNYWHSHFILGMAYRAKSMMEEAIAEFKKAVDLSGGTPTAVAQLSGTYYISGNKERAEKLLDSIKQRSKHEYVPATCFYIIHLVSGDLDQAFQWLEMAYEEHDSFVPWWMATKEERLRLPDEPRFKAMLKKMGLE